MSIGFSSSVNGINSALNANNVRSNNIANINTPGYKSKSPVQSESITGGSSVTSVKTDMSQGALQSSGDMLDLALEGAGYFEVTGPQGESLYRRSLRITTNENGRLVDGKGNALAGVNTTVAPSARIIVEQDGGVFSQVSSKNPIKIGQLLTVQFNNPQALNHTGNGIYSATAQAGSPVSASSTSIRQGYAEGANVDLAEQITGQITDEKSLAANVSAIKTKDKMLGEILDLMG